MASQEAVSSAQREIERRIEELSVIGGEAAAMSLTQSHSDPRSHTTERHVFVESSVGKDLEALLRQHIASSRGSKARYIVSSAPTSFSPSVMCESSANSFTVQPRTMLLSSVGRGKSSVLDSLLDPNRPAGWMSRSQRHKANKRAARKAAAEAVAAERTIQNSKRPLLKIPPEIRLIIYEYVMANNWDERQQAHAEVLNSCSYEDFAISDEEDDSHTEDFEEQFQQGESEFEKRTQEIEEKKGAFKRSSAEPAVVRVCRLMREEGMKANYQFLKAEKKRLTKRARELYDRVEEIMMDAPMDEWLDDDAESMAIVLDLIPDIEKEMKKLEHFGYGVAEAEKRGQAEDDKKEDEEVDAEAEKTDDNEESSGDEANAENNLPCKDDTADLSLEEKGLPTDLDPNLAEGSTDSRHRNIEALDEAMLQMALGQSQDAAMEEVD